MHLSNLLSLLTVTVMAVSASSLTITIPTSNILPNPHALPAGTHATLTTLSSSDLLPLDQSTADDTTKFYVSTSASSSSSSSPPRLIAPLTRSATFVFRNLPLPLPLPTSNRADSPSSYLLDIRSAEYVFAPYRIDLSRDGSILGVWETQRGFPWSHRGAEKYVASARTTSSTTSSVGNSEDGDVVNAITDVIVEARVVSRRNFYEERSKFSPLDMLKNPMILLAIVAMGMTFGLPKLMENMDPEMRAEFEKQSRTAPITGATRSALAGGAGGPGGFDLAGWMAGTSPGPMAAAGAADGAGSTTGAESGGAARRRT